MGYNDDGIIDEARVQCRDGHVWYYGLKVQFPKDLREEGKEFICQLSEVWEDGLIKFYRARKGKIYEEVVETVRIKKHVG
ncbi:hypothetical protein ACFLQL_01605 [Verrucomicrobiota bacterium]